MNRLTFLAAVALHLLIHESSAQQQRPLPQGVTALTNIAYIENGHQRQKLDLYLPEKSDADLPLVIWIHGGGWASGSKEGALPLTRGYVAKGYAVASINYRLSGDAVFPAQIEDCKAAIRWLRAHAKEHHLDPQRFGVWGSSAGGHLVAFVGTSGDVKEFDVGANLDQSSRVQAVCDWFGPTDFRLFVTAPGYEKHADAGSPESKLIGGAVLENKDNVARVNPITYVTKDDPPFLIIHGDKDATVPINQSSALYEALKQTGISAHFHTIHGAGHGGPGFSSKNIDEMVAAFFDAKLKSKSSAADKPEALVTESTAGAGGPGAATNQNQQRGPRWEDVLARDDKNHDGKISREEFSGPKQLFDRLDANHDGFLTKDEHDAFIHRAQ